MAAGHVANGVLMGTITARKRCDGSVGYTAQIRIMRDGATAHTEAKTFDRKQAAQAWIKRRETELSEPGALELARNPEPTLAEIIDRYLREQDAIKPTGRTKRFTLKQIGASDLGKLKPTDITSQVLIEYARNRCLEDGAKPATVQNDLVLLSSVFKVAEPSWGYRLSEDAMMKAKNVARHRGFIEHSQERSRIPTMEELDRLMAHFHDAARRRPWAVPMFKIVPFAIFSTRRQEEITRILWDDLNAKDQTVLVRDVKHPRKKIGNNQWAKLTDEAWGLIQSMPRVSERIFPFTTDAIGAQFTRACKWLEIDDLRFHDLRRAGVTRLFEMGWDIPRVAQVSLHRDWNMLRRYTNLKGVGDRYAGWKWIQMATNRSWSGRTNEYQSGIS